MTLYSPSHPSPAVVVYPALGSENAGRLHFRPFHVEAHHEIRFVGISLEQLASVLAVSNRAVLFGLVASWLAA